MSAELTQKYPACIFSEDSETIHWLFAQREEHNLLYQSRWDSEIKNSDDLLHRPSMAVFCQAKQS
jgi:hypothetical protein